MKTQQILEELIRIDSQCTTSNKSIADYIAKQLGRFHIQRYEFKSGELGLVNLVVKIPGESSASHLVFAGHTDTVAIDKKWTISSPFQPTEKQGRLYGLGASDMKAGLACMIAAALSLDKKPKNDVYLIFDADEEGDGLGGRELLKSFSLNNARVILAEPSHNKIVYANKGCLDVVIGLEGLECHSSKADFSYCQEHSAVHKAIETSRRILDYAQAIEARQDELLGKPTLNIGTIEGGKQANKVASSCQIKICRRLIPSESIEEEYEKIREIARSVDPKARITPAFWVSSFQGNKDGALARQIIEASAQIIPNLMFGAIPATTEANLLQKYGETLIFGPGNLDVAHEPDEYVELENLEKFTSIYKALMEG